MTIGITTNHAYADTQAYVMLINTTAYSCSSPFFNA